MGRMRIYTVATALALLSASRALAAQAGDVRAYEAARRGYYALKADAGRGHGREAWVAAAARFEQVAKSFPKSDKAPLALYTAAELRNQLSRVSLSAADRDAAGRDYDQVARLYPRSSLADDALYQLAHIALDRENDVGRARASLTDLLARYPHGDTAARARRLLAGLPERPQPPKTTVAKTAVARAAAGHAVQAPAQVTPDEAGHPSAQAPDDDDDDDQAPATVDEALRDPKATPRPVAKATQIESASKAAPDDPDERPEPVEPAEPAQSSPTQPSEAAPKHKPGNWPRLLEALRKVGPSPGGVPLAVQMGLRVRRVVIDPGHGGHDSGAIGPDGTLEKDVTLSVAQKLAQDLKAQGLEVLLTRNDDRFVALEDRAGFANQVKSDLFISIHCNAARDRKLRGTETYFLNVTDDRYALKLAARENQASEKSISDLQMILADLATKADVEESERLARSVQRTLVDGAHDGARRDLGVKHALFYVLLGTKMPSVLVETAFLSNPDDAKKLRSERYQSELAHAIAQGVGQFLDQRQGFATAIP